MGTVFLEGGLAVEGAFVVIGAVVGGAGAISNVGPAMGLAVGISSFTYGARVGTRFGTTPPPTSLTLGLDDAS